MSIGGTLLRLALLLFVCWPTAALAQDAALREAGKVVGTTGLNIRICPKVSCESHGLAQLGDPIIVTGEAENGFVPVEWAGKAGWAWYLYVSTPSRGTPFLEKGTPGCNRVAMIFNLGIGDELQIQALEWLKSQNVPATVFPMGWWATENPDLAKKIADLGFLVGTHGDERGNLPQYSDDDVIAELLGSEKNIGKAMGKDISAYFTPYAADMDERVRALVASKGYLPVAWDVPADDWDVGITPEYVYDRVVPNVVDGSIIEFHLDGPSSKESTAVALPWIVADLKKQGFTFVTIQDMAQPCGAGTPVPSSPQTAAQAASPVVSSATPAATPQPAS